jgi:hypothetical protein
MGPNRWLLPTLVALPLAVVAATDVYRLLAPRSFEDTSLLESGSPLTFDRSAMVVDLRADPPRVRGDETRVGVELGSGWGALDPQGRWSDGDRFEVAWTVPVGGQRVLFIEGRIDRNQAAGSRLAVAVNGQDAGGIELNRAMSRRSLSLSCALLFAGVNRLQFRLVDPLTGDADTSRTALIRRLAVAHDGSGGFPTAPDRTPVRRSTDGRSVIVRVEGRLALPFEVPTSGSELRFRYLFRDPDPGASCRVIVGRRYSGPDRFDVVRERLLTADSRAAGGFRQVLRDRGESSALVFHVNAAAARGGFIVENPRIEVRPDRPDGNAGRTRAKAGE